MTHLHIKQGDGRQTQLSNGIYRHNYHVFCPSWDRRHVARLQKKHVTDFDKLLGVS